MSLKGVQVITTVLLLFVSISKGDEGVEAEKRQFPYSALIFVNHNNSVNNLGEWVCTGTLISDNFVLTAGFCVEGIQKFRIKIGWKGVTRDNETGTESTEFSYDYIIYTKPIHTTDHVVALIGLNPYCSLTPEIQPVRIPVKQPNVNNWAIASGWNINEENNVELRFLPMRVVSDADCGTAYPWIDLNSTMCARAEGKFDSMCRSLGFVLVAENNTILGISISQISSSCENGPQIFARIKWYNTWISAAFAITSK